MTDPLYYYCENASSDSLTKKYSEDKFRRYKKLYLKELELLNDLRLGEDGFNRAARMFLGNVRVCVKQICFNSSLSNNDKKLLIREICNDDEFQKIIKKYPWNKNPIKQRIIIMLLKYKCVQLILWIV